ncbi:MAG: hypothetical protein R3C01_06605 [Planctomycetaceae bacterium]
MSKRHVFLQITLRHLMTLLALIGGGLFVMGRVSWAESPQASGFGRLGVPRGSETELSIAGKVGTLPATVWCSDPAVAVALNEKGDKLVISPAEATRPGRCWIRIANAEGATSLLPLMIGVLPEVMEVEPNNNLAKSQELTERGIVVNGSLHQGGEVDMYHMHLSAGETLVASVDAHRAFDSPIDTVLQIVSPQGRVLMQNDDHHGNDPQLAYTAAASGTVYVRIFGFPSAPNSTIAFAGSATSRYRLTVTTGPFVSHVIPADATSPDFDAAFDHPNGNWIATGENLSGVGRAVKEGSQDRLMTTAELRDVPGLHAMQFGDVASSEGSPRLNVWGALSTREEVMAVHTFPAKKGESLKVSVEAQRFGSQLDPVVRILGADGAVLKEADDVSRDNFDADFVWKAQADGDYELEVSDRFRHTGSRYFYRADVRIETPQVTATVGTDQFVLTTDKELKIPVTLTRIAGHVAPVTVELVGAPEGVTVTSAVTEKKKEVASIVTLELKTNGDVRFSGPVEIRVAETVRAESAGGDNSGPLPSVKATALLPIGGGRTPTIWLTVQAKDKAP